MPPKRRNQGSLALPAELADRIAAEGGGGGGSGGGGSDKRYTKRFKNAAGARKAARKQAREDKKQRRNTHHKREHGFAPPAAPARGQPASGAAPGRPRQPAKQPASKPAAAPAPPSDGRAQLVKFAKRNQGMYALLRESNLVDNVDNEAGVAGAAEGAEELEDREMRRLEKHLGIKSNAKLAAAFHDEGLGEILSGINYGSSKVRSTSGPSEPARPAAAEADNDPDLGEDGGDDDDDDDDAFGLNDAADDGSESDDSDVADMYRRQGINIDVELSDADGADNDSATDSNDDAAADSDSDSASDSDDGGDDGSVLDSDSDVRMADESTAVARDSVPAAVAASVSKYIPPSLRGKQSDESEDERMAAIRKTLRGQINRLSESNIEGIVLQIEAQYEKYPRGFVTEVLADLILQAIQSRIHMLDTFLFVNAAVVGAVYRLVGLEPVAHLVQKLMEEFERQFARGMADFKAGAGLDAAEDEVAAGKECQNLCVFVAELYNFQIVSCRLVYDVIRLCIQDVNEFTAELLLKLIRISGQQLRKDDPLALKEIVRQVADTVGRAGGGQLSVRCKFMVESLTSLKDNRMRSAMSQNADDVAKLKKFLGNMDKRHTVGGAEPINIGLQDIRDTKTKGKWWLVGASWVGNQHAADDGGASGAAAQQTALQMVRDESGNTEMERLLKMAKAQHMNTDIRRSVFVTLLSSDDYADAFERLLKLDLKRTQAREMMRVVIHCCGQERAYNPYYTLVACKLCAYHNTYQLTMQYALWDFLRELGEVDVGGLGRLSQDDDGGSSGADVPLRRIVNLAKMYAWLVDRQVLSLLILKTVTFAKVGQQARVFFQVLFSTLFLLHKDRTEKDAQALYRVFQRAAAANPTMCHGILFFFHHFVKACPLVDAAEQPVVRWGCKIAKQAIRSTSAVTTPMDG